MRDRFPLPELIAEFLDQGKVTVSLNLLHEDSMHDIPDEDDSAELVFCLEKTDKSKFHMDMVHLQIEGVSSNGEEYSGAFPYDAIYKISVIDKVSGKETVKHYPLNTPKSYTIVNEALDAYKEHEDRVREILGINELLAKADELTKTARDILNNVITGIEEDFFKNNQ